jgi:hypothetical protein
MALKLEQLSFVIVGAGTDAPGWKLVPDGHGGWTIVPVPGWNPEQMVELGSALRVVSAAASLKHPEVSKTILNSVGKLVASELGPAIDAHQAGAHVVVVLAH